MGSMSRWRQVAVDMKNKSAPPPFASFSVAHKRTCGLWQWKHMKKMGGGGVYKLNNTKKIIISINIMQMYVLHLTEYKSI
jgi:hypothetical protein